MKMKEIVWELTPNEYMYGIYFVVSHHTLFACKLMINPNMKSAQSGFKNCVYTMPSNIYKDVICFFFLLLPRLWAVFTAPCGHSPLRPCDRVRVSCVNIYLECARTMSADGLIKCGT